MGEGDLYCPVAALNLATSSAGTRPRSFTSMPCAFAHSRTSVVFSPLSGPRRPGDPYVAGQRIAQFPGVLGVQVDLVLRAVQAEANGSLGGAAIKVVDKQGLYLLSHGRSIPLTADLWRTSVDIQARQAYSRTGGISCHGHAPAEAVPRETGVLLRRLAACGPARVGGRVF